MLSAMKVLLAIYNYKAGFPFIQDIESNLKLQKGIEVDVLDTDQLFLKKHDGSIQHLVKANWINKMLHLPKIGTAIRVTILRRFLPKLRGKYDLVNIHNCDPIYIYLGRQFRKVSSNLYPMIWGSDFYRANKKMRDKKKNLFNNARYIVFANPVNAQDFVNYYNDYKEKAIITGFGVSKFDLIREIFLTEKQDNLKAKFGFPLNKMIVAVGYNGTQGQQHVKLLQELASLPEIIKQKLFLVLQMTYGFNNDYANEVEKYAVDTDIEYKMIREFLDDKETSRLRVAIDVVLNAQTTDGFSSSIQEHIFAKNIVVVGDWLPYKPLELAQIVYIQKPLGKFSEAVIEIIDGYERLKNAVQENSNKIYSISGWDTRIQNWISIYKGEGKKYLYNENEMQIK